MPDDEDDELVLGGGTLLLDDDEDEVRGFHGLDDDELLEDIACSRQTEPTYTGHTRRIHFRLSPAGHPPPQCATKAAWRISGAFWCTRLW